MFNIFTILVSYWRWHVQKSGRVSPQGHRISSRQPNDWIMILYWLHFVCLYMCCIVAPRTPPGRTYRADAFGNTRRAYQTQSRHKKIVRAAEPTQENRMCNRAGNTRRAYQTQSRRKKIVCAAEPTQENRMSKSPQPASRGKCIRRRADARKSYVQQSRRKRIVCPKVLQKLACIILHVMCIRMILYQRAFEAASYAITNWGQFVRPEARKSYVQQSREHEESVSDAEPTQENCMCSRGDARKLYGSTRLRLAAPPGPDSHL